MRRDVVKMARSFLAEEFPNRAAEVAQLDLTAPLFDLGLIDSLSFLGLVGKLEAQYAISVPPADFTPERFRTLDAIAAYVLQARGAA